MREPLRLKTRNRRLIACRRDKIGTLIVILFKNFPDQFRPLIKRLRAPKLFVCIKTTLGDFSAERAVKNHQGIAAENGFNRIHGDLLLF